MSRHVSPMSRHMSPAKTARPGKSQKPPFPALTGETLQAVQGGVRGRDELAMSLPSRRLGCGAPEDNHAVNMKRPQNVSYSTRMPR